MQNARRLPRGPLGRTGIEVSRLGLSGSFGIDADGVERAFHELGINYFFATPRMKGMVEGIRRLVSAGHRDEMVIACGASIPTGGSVGREWRKCARRFGVDYFDVWHLFWVQAHWYVTGKTWPAMVRLKESGQARALAISCHDRSMVRTLVDELDLDAIMIRYNAAHRGAEAEILAHLPPGQNRPGVISYTATRWRRLLKAAKGLGPMTAPECYRFTLEAPQIDVTLCGGSTYEELQSDAEGVLAGPLAPERLAAVKAFGDTVRSTARGRIGFWRS